MRNAQVIELMIALAPIAIVILILAAAVMVAGGRIVDALHANASKANRAMEETIRTQLGQTFSMKSMLEYAEQIRTDVRSLANNSMSNDMLRGSLIFAQTAYTVLVRLASEAMTNTSNELLALEKEHAKYANREAAIRAPGAFPL